MSKPSYKKTGIKTSIFYHQSKLDTLPRLLKARPEPINVIERQNQTKNRPGNPQKHSQKSIQKKNLGMSNKRDCKIKLCKINNKNVKVEKNFSDGKANDVGSLHIGKRSSYKMESKEYEQVRCKKIKLDMNKNIESNVRGCTHSEICSESKFKSQDTDAKTEELDSQGSTVCLSSSPNIFDSDLTTERDLFDTRKLCRNDHLFGVSSSSNAGGRCIDGTSSTSEISNSLPIITNHVIEQKQPINDIFGTPSIFCQGEDSSKENEQINAKLNGLSNVNDNVIKSYQRVQTSAIKVNEYDVNECTPSSPCTSEKSLKGTNQNITKLNSSPIGNNKVLTSNQREPSDATKESDYNILRSTANSSQNQDSLKRADQNSAKLNSSTNRYAKDSTSRRREPFEGTKECEYDILGGISTSSSKSEDRLKRIFQKNAKSRSPRKKMGSLDAFFTIENTRTSKIKEKPKDSRFHEPFKILGELSSQEERSCSSTTSSPLLFSQKSTSSGSSGLSKTKSISPDSQSSIMKYFTPLRKSPSLSPSSDKKRQRLLKGRKATSPSGSPATCKKEQMFLDLGQKNFGHVTCPTCHMVYTIAQPEDEAYHVKFHHKVFSGLRFNGWKSERVVEHFDDGRVIVVLPHDPPSHLKKVESVRMVVDNELGFSSETSQRMQDCKTYMFVADKRVVGCVVAVVIQEAFPLIPNTANGTKNETLEQGAWCCSSEPVRAQCGISRIWVLQQYRRKRIASRILDCVRSDFMFGGVIAKELLAFSDPTPLGKQLAESYCGTDNFLVFR